MKRWDWRRVLLAFGAALLGLAICELVLWAAGIEPSSGRELQVRCEARQRGDDWRCRHMFFQQDRFREDPDLLWAPRPGARPFNRLGYRGPVVEQPKPAGTVRVVAVGDSNTLGPAGMAWPDYLQIELTRQLQRPVEVLNGGVYGYTSYQGIRRLEQMLNYEPDLVLVSFGSNDALPTADLPDAEFARISRTVHHGAQRGLRLRSVEILAHWLRQRTRPGLSPRVSIDDYRKNLVRMVEMARKHGAPTVLLTRPLVQAYCPMDQIGWRGQVPHYNATAMEVAAAEEMTAVDVHRHFNERRELFVDESHFTDGGSREMASLLLETVLEAIGEKREIERVAEPTIHLEPPVELPGAGASAPTAAMDRSGRTHVVWVGSEPHPGVIYARLSSDGVDHTTRLADTAEPLGGVALAVHAEDDRLAVAWSDRGTLVWTRSSNGGDQFATPGPVLADRVTVAPPTLAYADGRLWLGWVEAGEADSANAWLTTRSRSGWAPATQVGSGLCKGAPVALLEGLQPGQLWMAQRGFDGAPDGVAIRMLQWRHDRVVKDELQQVTADLPATEACSERAPQLGLGTSPQPLVVFVSATGAERRVLHTTTSCPPPVARPMGTDWRPQSRPTITGIDSGVVVAAWQDLSGRVPRIRIGYSENGGDWFSSGAPVGGGEAEQLTPSLAGNLEAEAFVLAYVQGGRCVVQRGRVIDPPPAK